MHIILYILDALRFDHLGCFGYERDISPHIDAIAREGVIFLNCFSPATWTRPVAASILSGTYPGVHLTKARYDMFTSDLERLPEVLRRNGFKTAAFSTMVNIASDIGFDKGFDHYFDLFRESEVVKKRKKRGVHQELVNVLGNDEFVFAGAEDLNDYYFSWLAKEQYSNTFSFMWSIETHAPYEVPDEFNKFSVPEISPRLQYLCKDPRKANKSDREGLIKLYDNTVHYNDNFIGKMVAFLKEMGVYDDTLLIIASDHGESFFEHGTYSHGQIPYDELIHVPMINKFPNGLYTGKEVRALVELIDIFPTIIEVANIPSNTYDKSVLQGYSLFPLIEGIKDQIRFYVYSDTCPPNINVQKHWTSVRSLRWKYIKTESFIQTGRRLGTQLKAVLKKPKRILSIKHLLQIIKHRYIQKRSGEELLYALESDPDERINLSKEFPDVVSQFRHELEVWQSRNKELAKQIKSTTLNYEESEALRQHLAKLGYMD